MLKIKEPHLTKKDISKKINSKIGLSALYANQLTDDLIFILKKLIKVEETNIKNFGTFKIINKNERIGRNPKNKKTYKITARKSLSFSISKNFNNKMNDL
jgi:nucleoid DNA-binding protein